MDQREIERQDRERWRILDRLSNAVEELAEAEHGRAKQTAAVKALLKVLGSEDEDASVLAKLDAMPKNVSESVAHKLNTDALDLIRHVRYWLGELNKLEPGAQPEQLPPVPPAGSGAWAVKPEDRTGVFDRQHSDGRPQGAHEMLGKAVVWFVKNPWVHKLAAAAGAAIVTWWKLRGH